MHIGRVHSFKKVTAQLILLATPTMALVCYLLHSANSYFSILENNWLQQSSFFAAGVAAAIIFYSYRFRFITTLTVLFIIYFFTYKMLGHISAGEFDAFLFSVKFLIFSYLFSAGWLAGYGFSRSRYFTVFWSLFLLAMQIVVVSKTSDISANALIVAFGPVLLYTFYIIYTTELIRNMNEEQRGFAWFITRRLLGFTGFAVMLLFAMLLIFQKEFKAVEKDWGGKDGGDKKTSGKESLTKQNKDGSVSNKDQMKITGSLSKDKRLVFVAKLDNYFPDGRTPNPLYFTSLYYTKFDTSTQTFETDSNIPSNDLFSPDPAKIPLYFAKTDTVVIRNAMATLSRRIVSADVYRAALSPHDYVAPSTSFFCQPLPVENEYKSQFKSAYRAKMWVSALNSAYFIYNPAGNRQLETFQQLRFAELRKAAGYTLVDKKFMDYYTFMPRNEEYSRITTLAKEITKNAKTPVDKMIAIRSYFTGNDEFGQPLFKYSDNPGIPGLPSASKLNYFLFENRKGYCAYFAGATLFMLRSLGIPSRIAAGYLTVDRSSKNPGWYWFYADQAHAWVQLYFPGYGWIDFDTTVPDRNTQESPQPDGTPPMNTQQAQLVADGRAISVDTVAKRVTMKVNKILYHDENIPAPQPADMLMDVSIAAITRDTGAGRLSDIKVGSNIVAVSYAEALKKIEPGSNDDLALLLTRLPKPAPIDEIKIMETEEEKKQRENRKEAEAAPIDWMKILWACLSIIAALVIILFSLPWMVWQWLNFKAKQNNSGKALAYNIYRAATYYLNQMGLARTGSSPQDYAAAIDKKYGSSFGSFAGIYQKIKYSTIALTDGEAAIIQQFYNPFIKQVKTQIPFKKRFSNFLNVERTFRFFKKLKIFPDMGRKFSAISGSYQIIIKWNNKYRQTRH